MTTPNDTTLMVSHALQQLLEVEPTIELFSEKPSTQRAVSLAELNAQFCTCTRCPLAGTRTNYVFGVGNDSADILFIGEAPGRDEDLKGEPFVGRAGQLLDKMLAAIDLNRSDVYIANILKCRPPENRDPLPEEAAACLPQLAEQIRLIQPKLICALGRIAAQILLDTKTTLTKMRGQFYDVAGAKMLATYHPAALLRNPNFKKGAWEDLQLLRRTYDELMGRKSRF